MKKDKYQTRPELRKSSGLVCAMVTGRRRGAQLFADNRNSCCLSAIYYIFPDIYADELNGKMRNSKIKLYK